MTRWAALGGVALLIVLALAGCQGMMTPQAAAPETPPFEEPSTAADANPGGAPVPEAENVRIDSNLGNMSAISTMVIERGMGEVARECVDCHKTENAGIVNDWKDSRHAHAGVSCLDCHIVDEACQWPRNMSNFLVSTDVYISALVPASTCSRTRHPVEAEQFDASGHFRAYHQQVPKDSLHALTWKHEGQEHPEFGTAPNETGCIQCHRQRSSSMTIIDLSPRRGQTQASATSIPMEVQVAVQSAIRGMPSALKRLVNLPPVRLVI